MYLVSFLMSVGSQISVMLNSDEPKTCIRTAEISKLAQRHIDKPLNGIFFNHLEHHGLPNKLTLSSKSSNGLRSGMQGFIIGSQDGSISVLENSFILCAGTSM